MVVGRRDGEEGKYSGEEEGRDIKELLSSRTWIHYSLFHFSVARRALLGVQCPFSHRY